jgi:hypothetical protein
MNPKIFAKIRHEREIQNPNAPVWMHNIIVMQEAQNVNSEAT